MLTRMSYELSIRYIVLFRIVCTFAFTSKMPSAAELLEIPQLVAVALNLDSMVIIQSYSWLTLAHRMNTTGLVTSPVTSEHQI